MDEIQYNLNELLVKLFNFILYIEEKNLKTNGIKLSMNEVHILEAVQKSKDTSMSYLANRLMITQGTFTTNANRLIKKGYIIRKQDNRDKRINRLELTEIAYPILKIHEEFHKIMIDKAIKDLKLDESEVLNKFFDQILTYFKDEYQHLTMK